jgi:hypothetical protein
MKGKVYSGDGFDRYNTGGGNFSLFMYEIGTLTYGTNVFTGMRDFVGGSSESPNFTGYRFSPGNPANGTFGTYAQIGLGVSQSSGMTYYNFVGPRLISHEEIFGANQMWSQNWIHENMVSNPLFESDAGDPYIDPLAPINTNGN